MLNIAFHFTFNTKRNKPSFMVYCALPKDMNLLDTNSDSHKQNLKAYCKSMKMVFLSFAQCWPTTHQIVACLYCMYSQYGYLKCKALVFLPVLALKVKIIQLKLLHFTFKECIIYLLIKESYQNSKM